MGRKQGRVRRTFWAAVTGAFLLSHCAEAGLNQNESMAGNQDNGVSVGFGAIAIDPQGQYLLSRSGDSLVFGDLQSGKARTLDDVLSPERIAFANHDDTVFATHVDSEDSGRLYRYDVLKNRALWQRQIPVQLSWDTDGLGSRPWIDVLSDDSRVVLSFENFVALVNAQDGSTIFQTPKGARVVDVDITPDEKHLIITREETWSADKTQPVTELEVRDLATFEMRSIRVPNCSSELTLTPDGGHAFLAPSQCQRDPVSVIDLKTWQFVRNLPGFGPVAIAPDGQVAIAFMDSQQLDKTLVDDPKTLPDAKHGRYYLMLIDTDTLAFELVPIGDTLPRYALAPDGKLLLVDSGSLWDDGRVRVLDVATRSLTPVMGPEVSLDSYVMTRDSSKVYLLDHGLYRIDLKPRKVHAEALDFMPEAINITPDDHKLVLRQDDDTLWIYDAVNGTMLRSMSIE